MKSRKASFIEDFYIERNELDTYTNFQVYAEYSSDLPLNQIYNALHGMVKDYQQLSLQAFKDSQGASIRLVEKYTLSDVLEVRTIDDLDLNSLLTELNQVRFELGVEKPTWKIVLLNSNKLIFYCDHLFYDGTSGLNFHKIFNKYLNKKSSYIAPTFNGLESVLFDVSVEGKDLDLPPNATDIIDYKASWPFFIKKLASVYAPGFIKRLVAYTTGEEFTSEMKNTFYENDKVPKLTHKWDDFVFVYNIPTETLKKLISIAKSQKIKLTVMIYMILQLSLLPITGEQDTSVSIPANIRDMIDTDSARSLCPGFDGQFGLYMGDIKLALPSFKRLGMSTGKINWDVARSAQKQLEIKKKEAAMIFNLLELISSEKFLKNELSKHRTQTFEISNLGSYNNEPENAIKIVDMIFSQPMSLGTGYFGCSVTGTDIGGVNLALAGVKDLKDEFKQFCDGVDQWIETLVTGS